MENQPVIQDIQIPRDIAAIQKDSNANEVISAVTESLMNEELPRNLNLERFLLNCQKVLSTIKTPITEFNKKSLIAALSKGAVLGLDFFMGECHCIYKAEKFEFAYDYKGRKKLCEMYSARKIQDVYAMLIRDGDKFEERVSKNVRYFNYVNAPMTGKSRPIIGAFAVVLYADGGAICERMEVDEVEEIKLKYNPLTGKAAVDIYSPWVKSWASKGEMIKKTVLNRALKLVPMTFISSKQEELYKEDPEFDPKKPIGIENPKKYTVQEGVL
jgi:recombination protein RecT